MLLRIKKPAPIISDSLIAVVSPSGPVNKGNILIATDSLKKYGFKFELLKNLFEKDDYLAGSDRDRFSDLKEAFLDNKYGAIICSRGGYGSMRILDALSKLRLTKVKPFFGFSDITALHIFLNRQGWVTFHSPNLNGLSRLNQKSKRFFVDILKNNVDFTKVTYKAKFIINRGIANGRLIGGNLSIISSLSGTRFDIGLKDKILFIEDVDEKPYRLDRMLTQLRLRADFQYLRGIVTGRFNGCGREKEILKVLRCCLGGTNIPVLYGIDAGHVRENLVLPLNIKYILNAKRGLLIPQEKPFL